jgi:uncharacterized membrane protein
MLTISEMAEQSFRKHSLRIVQSNGGVMETRLRSIVKAVIWNLIGLSVMAVVGLIVTGSLTAGGVMAVINTVIGFTTYVLYERVWSRIDWGRCHG